MSRRGVFNTADGIVVRELPDVEPTGARVRVTSAGICSTDFWIMAQGPVPFVLGHEFAGRLDDGSLVAVYPLVPCLVCDQCATGAHNRCRRVFESTLGLGADGGMCDGLYVPEASVTRLPDGVRAQDASLVEPIAVALHALGRVSLEPGQRVAVVGAGPVGLIVGAIARARGCEVAIAGRHRHQEAAAERFELARALSGVYDVVVDAAGTDDGLHRAAELVSPGGTLLLLGIYDPSGVTFPALPLLMKEATIVTSTAYCCNERVDDFAAAAAFLADHPELPEAIISHRFGLEDARAAFAAAADRAAGALKVVIEPSL